MKVRMKVQISGTRNGEDWPPVGEVADIPTGEAQHLVASGIAEEVGKDDESAVETATAPVAAEEKRPAGRTKPAAPKG